MGVATSSKLALASMALAASVGGRGLRGPGSCTALVGHFAIATGTHGLSAPTPVGSVNFSFPLLIGYGQKLACIV